MSDVVYISKSKIERKNGPLRIAFLAGEPLPVVFSVHGAIAEHLPRMTRTPSSVSTSPVISPVAYTWRCAFPDYAWFSLCISLCIVGCAIMIASDAQKYFTLRLKRGLITDGMFRFIRHPNYLGEMMIYSSFALMVWHWLPFVVLAWVWGGLFAVNMILKETSMSRYPGWGQYKKRSWWLLPPLV